MNKEKEMNNLRMKYSGYSKRKAFRRGCALFVQLNEDLLVLNPGTLLRYPKQTEELLQFSKGAVYFLVLL